MRDKILQFLVENPHPHSSREIQKAVEATSIAIVQRHLKSLHESQQIARHGGKRGRHVTYEIKRDEVA